jgi:hypothetical protein
LWELEFQGQSNTNSKNTYKHISARCRSRSSWCLIAYVELWWFSIWDWLLVARFVERPYLILRIQGDSNI